MIADQLTDNQTIAVCAMVAVIVICFTVYGVLVVKYENKPKGKS